MPKGNFMTNPLCRPSDQPKQPGVGESTSKSVKVARENPAPKTGSPVGPGIAKIKVGGGY